MMLDRWNWLKHRLPRTNERLKLLDVGCGTGAFTIAAAKRGYEALGLSWDQRNQRVAQERAQLCGADHASFEIQDVRTLDARPDFIGQYDYVICLECIEHILDDIKLMKSMAACLKPHGRLLLTTPNYLYWPISKYDSGPFKQEETGWHVRRGYSPKMLEKLCTQAGLICEEVSYCSGPLSQLIARPYRFLDERSTMMAWGITLPLRPLPVLFDRWLSKISERPGFSICLEAWKSTK
jgi:2-polyprenyl-3-methyl-5-hydroxy-6-metoxy-1,4-benzoquinol methylase